MALSETIRRGEQWEFGFPTGTEAPTLTGVFLRSAELRYESEVFAQATNGEGHTDSIVMSLPENRKITGTFTGYIKANFNPESIAPTFSFQSRTFIIRNVGYPRRKGEFVEVSVEAESYKLIT